MEEAIQLNCPQNKKIFYEALIGGSKSISNRFFILNHLAKKKCTPVNESDSEDTQTLKKNLEIISSQNSAILHCGHGGTTFRFLLPVLCITPGEWILDGSERLRQRPHRTLVESLLNLGADIRWKGDSIQPPFFIRGKKLQSLTLTVKSDISSQYLSAILMIAPLLPDGITIELPGKVASESYLLMTLQMMKQFGIQTIYNENKIQVNPGIYTYGQTRYFIESDWSSASYWYSFLALAEDGKIFLKHFSENSLQGDSVLPKIYEKLGIQTIHHRAEKGIELTKIPNFQKPDRLEFDMKNCPDLTMALSVTCAGMKIPVVLKGLDTLNYKESERIKVLAEYFRMLQIEVVVDNSTLELKQFPENFPGNLTVFAHDDHRIVMGFSALAFKIPELVIHQPDAVRKSYPTFFKELQNVGFRVKNVNATK